MNQKKCGIIHKLVKKDIITYIKPGVKLYDIRRQIETLINKYSRSSINSYDYNSSAIAFPVGLSLNNVAAHHSPFSYENTIYTENDILKIDYGVQFKGEMVDAAFSITHNPELEKLKIISENATNLAIKEAGVDADLNDIGSNIEEYISSNEIEIKGKLYPVIPCKDLCGHQILPFKIHGLKVIPNVKVSKLFYRKRMDDGEIYAVETFPTTGSGILKKGKNNSHYMINYFDNIPKKYKDNQTLNQIMKKRNTLPWHLDWLSGEINLNELKNLVDKNIIHEYPPLIDKEKSFVAQTEHTIGIFENGVKIYT